MQGTLEVFGNLSALRRAAMQIENQVAEPAIVKSVKDGIDSGSLFGNEENLLAARGERRDEVGDRLTLARPRWTANDEVRAAEHRIDRVVLTRIGIENQ